VPDITHYCTLVPPLLPKNRKGGNKPPPTPPKMPHTHIQHPRAFSPDPSIISSSHLGLRIADCQCTHTWEARRQLEQDPSNSFHHVWTDVINGGEGPCGGTDRNSFSRWWEIWPRELAGLKPTCVPPTTNNHAACTHARPPTTTTAPIPLAGRSSSLALSRLFLSRAQGGGKGACFRMIDDLIEHMAHVGETKRETVLSTWAILQLANSKQQQQQVASSPLPRARPMDGLTILILIEEET
ncbi:uncharacterized protein K489DRAFT_426866, partial [Dissoconium aciculare CBS 342.82]|uniref:Uncharacterized protein n=1 Tax=Dissoconium aciculare CBS 342.82 TaxID=1314786 RepID=A0A6J3LYV0_9PEZI